MAIRKQEFYEGAALHLLARNGSIRSIRYNPPLFLVNDEVFLLLKYSTKGRSPWGFTFTTDEQRLLVRTCTHTRCLIKGLEQPALLRRFGSTVLSVAPAGLRNLLASCAAPEPSFEQSSACALRTAPAR
jgi:hypothetical protein